MYGMGVGMRKNMKGGFLMQKTKKQAVQNPLTLKEWIYATDGKQIKELIKTCFLEFYFAKQTNKIRQNP